MAHIYFTNQQTGMQYPTYRARGLPIRSGTIESGCKQLVTSRLKGAGMIWRATGARQVRKVRARRRIGGGKRPWRCARSPGAGHG